MKIEEVETQLKEVTIDKDNIKVAVLHVGSCNFNDDREVDNQSDTAYTKYVKTISTVSTELPIADIIISGIPPRGCGLANK